MENIKREFEKHKKAIAYAFFDSNEAIELIEIKKEEIGIVLCLSNNEKVIYENGNIDLETGFQKYLSWFNQNINKEKKQYIKNILTYATCTFREYIEHEEIEELELEKEYYSRYGSLCSIVASLHSEMPIGYGIRRKKQYPVVQNISEILKLGVEFVVPIEVKQLEKMIKKEKMTVEQKKIFMKAYERCRAFIETNATDIKMLINLCFVEESVIC